MNKSIPTAAISPLRQRLIDDMDMRRFSRETQRNHIRDVGRFATFLGRSPDTATADDLRRFQIEQRDAGVPTPTMNSIVSALRFFFTHTIDRPDLTRKLIRVAYPRNLPMVLSRDEVARLLNATTCLKHQAALSVAYGAGLRVAEVAALKVADSPTTRAGLSSRRRTARFPGVGRTMRFHWTSTRCSSAMPAAAWTRRASLGSPISNEKKSSRAPPPADSAPIGDSRALYHDGILSHVNGPASLRGGRVGMKLNDFIEILIAAAKR